MEYMEQKMDELIEAGLHMEADLHVETEMKPKTGRYVFEIKIPVTVLYSKRDDNTTSIDCVSVPPEDDIYLIVDKHAKAIKAGAEVRATDAADGKGQCNKEAEEEWDTFQAEMQEEEEELFE